MDMKNNFKVVLLGEGCVGKTSLVLRFVEGKFNSKHESTLQASFLTKKITLENGQIIQLNIWDTAGQERFHALGPIYYRGAQGAILVYDITDQDSFQKVKNWVKELKRMLSTDIVIIIAGNKSDIDHNRTVPQDDAFAYAESVGAHYIETSAKQNHGVEELFTGLTRWMVSVRNEKEEEIPAIPYSGGRNVNRLVLEDDLNGGGEGVTPEPPTRSCC